MYINLHVVYHVQMQQLSVCSNYVLNKLIFAIIDYHTNKKQYIFISIFYMTVASFNTTRDCI